MSYHLCPGVVLASVGDEYLLVATRAARGKVAYAKGVNQTGAYFWTLLEQGLDVETMVRQTASDYKASEEQARPILQRFLSTLEEAGYLTWDGEQP